MLCKHEWKILSETVTKSKFECAMEVIGTLGKGTIPHQMSCANRKHIQVFACDKCGKLKRFVEQL
jgi:hypothetical protein